MVEAKQDRLSRIRSYESKRSLRRWPIQSNTESDPCWDGSWLRQREVTETETIYSKHRLISTTKIVLIRGRLVFQWKYLNRKLPGTQAKPEHSIVAVETQEDYRSCKRDPRKRDPEAVVSDESHRKPSEEWKLGSPCVTWERRQRWNHITSDRQIARERIIVEEETSTPMNVLIRWRSKLQRKFLICEIALSITLEALT